MAHSTENRARTIATLTETATQLADRGMFLSLVMSGGNIAYTALGGGTPHWAAFAGAAVSAAYLLIPKARSLALGGIASDYPREALAAAGKCALEAYRNGDDGIWAVHHRDTGRTEFMTDFEFRRYAAALPEDLDLAVVESVRDEVHVKRYVGGALQSGEDCAAHEVYAADGTLMRSMDYDRGEYRGMHDPEPTVSYSP